MRGPARRYEQVTIVAELDGATAEKHRDDVEEILGRFPLVTDNDTLKVSYTYTCEYYGRVVDRFEAMINLLESDDVKALKVIVPVYTKSLILELGARLERVMSRLEKMRSEEKPDEK